MHSKGIQFFAATFLLFAASSFSVAQEKREQPPVESETAAIGDSIRDLIHELENLEDDIVSDLTGAKERSLYRRAEAALREALSFRRAARAEAPADELSRSFHRLDERIEQLLKDVAALDDNQRAIKRAARRVRRAEDELHEAFVLRGNSAVPSNRLVQRQAASMAEAADRLERVAIYTFGDEPGHGVLIANLKTLKQASERFQKSAETNRGVDQLKREVGLLTEAWANVARGLDDLKIEDGVYLIQSAARVDRLHESIYRLLGITGNRPRLIIRS